MHDSNTQRFHLSCQTPVGWLRAISDGSHLIYLDWNQIGWTDPDRPNHVSRETITQLMAYFAGRRTHFTIPLRPANISPARQHSVWHHHQLCRICRRRRRIQRRQGRRNLLCHKPHTHHLPLSPGRTQKWHARTL